MKIGFRHTVAHKLSEEIDTGLAVKLASAIRGSTDYAYSCVERSYGYFLEPTFRDMPNIRNSLVPEISVSTSQKNNETTLYVSVQPSTIIRLFLYLWFGLWALLEILLIILTITSKTDSIAPLMAVSAMGIIVYSIIKVATNKMYRDLAEDVIYVYTHE